MVPRMGLGSTSRNWNYDWVDALDVEDMLDVCELTIRASLQRKESRGYFFREDYPLIDNGNWLKHTVATRVGDDIRFEYTPAAQKFATGKRDGRFPDRGLLGPWAPPHTSRRGSFATTRRPMRPRATTPSRCPSSRGCACSTFSNTPSKTAASGWAFAISAA